MPAPEGEDRVDPAALAIAAFVAAWPLFSERGPFEHWSFIVGVTLLLVICSYQWKRLRSHWQNAAFGAVCAVPALLVYGYFREVWCADWRLDTSIGAGGERVVDTRIPPLELTIAWAGLTILFAAIGYWGSRSRSDEMAGRGRELSSASGYDHG